MAIWTSCVFWNYYSSEFTEKSFRDIIKSNRNQIVVTIWNVRKFGTSVWFEINWKMVNTIWFQVDSIRFRKDFSVYVQTQRIEQLLVYFEFRKASFWPCCLWGLPLPYKRSLPINRLLEKGHRKILITV